MPPSRRRRCKKGSNRRTRREKKYSRRRYKMKGGTHLSQILGSLEELLQQLSLQDKETKKQYNKRISDINDKHTWLLLAQSISRSVSSLDDSLEKYNEEDDIKTVLKLAVDNIGTLMETKQDVSSEEKEQYHKVKTKHDEVNEYL
jgi:hypothetical protein